MNIKTVFLISILSIYIFKILWNIYLHSVIDDLSTSSNDFNINFDFVNCEQYNIEQLIKTAKSLGLSSEGTAADICNRLRDYKSLKESATQTTTIPGFYKIMAGFNIILSIASLIIFFTYLSQIDNNKYTKYATFSLFFITLILESVKLYVFMNVDQIVGFNAIIRGVTSGLTVAFASTIILMFYVIKTNKINSEIELTSFKDDDMDLLSKDLDDFDFDDDLLDDRLDIEMAKLEDVEKSTKNKLEQLEKTNKDLLSKLEQSNQQRKNISFNL